MAKLLSKKATQSASVWEQLYEEYLEPMSANPDVYKDDVTIQLSFLQRATVEHGVEGSAEQLIDELVGVAEMFVNRFGAERSEGSAHLAALAKMQIDLVLLTAFEMGMISDDEYSDLQESLDLPFIVLIKDRWKMRWPDFQKLLNRDYNARVLKEPLRVEELTAQGQRLKAMGKWATKTNTRKLGILLSVLGSIYLIWIFMNRKLLASHRAETIVEYHSLINAANNGAFDPLPGKDENNVVSDEIWIKKWFMKIGSTMQALVADTDLKFHDIMEKRIREIVEANYGGDYKVAQAPQSLIDITASFPPSFGGKGEDARVKFENYVKLLLKHIPIDNQLRGVPILTFTERLLGNWKPWTALGVITFTGNIGPLMQLIGTVFLGIVTIAVAHITNSRSSAELAGLKTAQQESAKSIAALTLRLETQSESNQINIRRLEGVQRDTRELLEDEQAELRDTLKLLEPTLVKGNLSITGPADTVSITLSH